MIRETYSSLPNLKFMSKRKSKKNMNTNAKGNIAIGQAIAYFTTEGYTISIPLNDCQW